MADVTFLKGLQADYDALDPKSNDTLYHCTDSDRFFIGEKELVDPNDIATAIAAISAEDIPVEDEGDLFVATDVEGVLAELSGRISSGTAESKTIYLVDATSQQSTYGGVWRIYQGANSSDMSQNTLVGTINVEKEKVVSSGKVVTVTNGIDSDGDSTSVADGTYIKLILQNVITPLYINVQDLVDAYSGGANTEITVSVSDQNVITATVGKIASSKIVTRVASGDVTEQTLDAKLTAIDSQIADMPNTMDSKINALDATKSQTASTDGLALSITQTDGKITSISGSIASGTYDASGAASAVLGTSSDTASANTVYGAKAAAAAAAGRITRTTTTSTLTATSWSNGKYSFESTYPASTYNMVVAPAEDITVAQLNAFAKARIIADDSTNVLIAMGTVPSVNIPIKITYFKV